MAKKSPSRPADPKFCEVLLAEAPHLFAITEVADALFYEDHPLAEKLINALCGVYEQQQWLGIINCEALSRTEAAVEKQKETANRNAERDKKIYSDALAMNRKAANWASKLGDQYGISAKRIKNIVSEQEQIRKSQKVSK